MLIVFVANIIIITIINIADSEIKVTQLRNQNLNRLSLLSIKKVRFHFACLVYCHDFFFLSF